MGLYAHLATGTGWSFEYIREHVDIPTALALLDYWREAPPAHLVLRGIEDLLAGFFGAKRRGAQPGAIGAPASGDELEQLKAALPMRPAPKFITPEQYYATKGAHEHA